MLANPQAYKTPYMCIKAWPTLPGHMHLVVSIQKQEENYHSFNLMLDQVWYIVKILQKLNKIEVCCLWKQFFVIELQLKIVGKVSLEIQFF